MNSTIGGIADQAALVRLVEQCAAIDDSFDGDLNHVRQWAAFTRSLGGEAPPGLGVVIDKISEFVLPP